MKILDQLIPTNELGFGKSFCPKMIISHYRDGAWTPCELSSNLDITLSSASKVFHYAQEVFEGLKAYKTDGGRIHMFRPQENIRRMTKSANLLAMPPFSEAEYLDALKRLCRECKEFVPDSPGALYLRPTMVGTSSHLGVAPAAEYLFFILANPVGGYFGESFVDRPASIRIWATTDFVRAVRGGVGAAKTGGNYAASLRAVKESKRLGYDNVLFLDAIGRENIEEMSGMNVFAKFGDTWKTPPIGDTILDGVTRKSIIDLCREQNFKVTEENFTIKELTQGAKSGELKEFFACGTAAAITTIREIGWQGENYQINGGEIGADTQTLFSAMTGIHYGQRQAPNPEWLIEI